MTCQRGVGYTENNTASPGTFYQDTEKDLKCLMVYPRLTARSPVVVARKRSYIVKHSAETLFRDCNSFQEMFKQRKVSIYPQWNVFASNSNGPSGQPMATSKEKSLLKPVNVDTNLLSSINTSTGWLFMHCHLICECV